MFDDNPPTGISRAAWNEAKRRFRREKSGKGPTHDDGFMQGDAGQILKGHPANIRHAVQGLGVNLRLNQFSVQTDVAGLDGHGPELDDAGAVRLRLLIHEVYSFLPTQELFEQVLIDVAQRTASIPCENISTGSSGMEESG